MADEKNLNETEEEVKEAAEEVVEETTETAEETVEETAAEETTEAVEETIEEAATEEAVEETTEEAATEETAEETVETDEEVAEAIEEAAEETAEDAEADAEEAEEELSEVDRAVAEALAERDAADAAAKEDRNKKLKIAGIIAGVVIIIAGVILSGFVSKDADGGMRFNTYSGWLPKLVNKYNHMGYVDVTGNTIGDIAESMGMNVEDFKEEFGLPKDMPASTNEMTAMYFIPASNYGSMYGLDFATMKDILHIPDTTEDGEPITEDTLWGIVQGEITIADYVGDTGDGEAVKSFKEEFGFGDDITGETKWKVVRNTVDEANRKAEIERKKAASKPAAEDEIVDLEDVIEVEDGTDTADNAAADTETADTAETADKAAE